MTRAANRLVSYTKLVSFGGETTKVMFHQRKFVRHYLLLAIILVFLVDFNLAATKVLYSFVIESEISTRNETGVLINVGTPEEELVVTGRISTTFPIPNNEAEAYKDITTYTADKNGYRVKYKLIRVPIVDTRISAKALMSSGG